MSGPVRHEGSMTTDTIDTPYDKLIAACHALAEDAYGPGTNISVDREGSGFICRVWNAKGGLSFIGPEGGRNKAEAFRKLKASFGKNLKAKAAKARASITEDAMCTCDHVFGEHSKTGKCQAQTEDDYCPCASFEARCTDPELARSLACEGRDDGRGAENVTDDDAPREMKRGSALR